MDVLSTIFFKTILFTKTEGLIFVLYLIPGWISRLAESRDREIGRKVSPTTPLKYRQWGRALSYIRGLFPSATGALVMRHPSFMPAHFGHSIKVSSFLKVKTKLTIPKYTGFFNSIHVSSIISRFS